MVRKGFMWEVDWPKLYGRPVGNIIGSVYKYEQCWFGIVRIDWDGAAYCFLSALSKTSPNENNEMV